MHRVPRPVCNAFRTFSTLKNRYHTAFPTTNKMRRIYFQILLYCLRSQNDIKIIFFLTGSLVLWIRTGKSYICYPVCSVWNPVCNSLFLSLQRFLDILQKMRNNTHTCYRTAKMTWKDLIYIIKICYFSINSKFHFLLWKQTKIERHISSGQVIRISRVL